MDLSTFQRSEKRLYLQSLYAAPLSNQDEIEEEQPESLLLKLLEDEDTTKEQKLQESSDVSDSPNL